MTAKVFSPAKAKEETEKSQGRKEGETIELYPKGRLMVIHSDKCSDKVPGGNRAKISISQSELSKDTLEEIAPIPSNMEVEMLKQWDKERDRADQRNRGLEESLGIALQAIKRLGEIMQAKKSGRAREEQSIPVLEEGKEVDFFQQGKSQQGVVEETEEEEEYLTIGEDGRPYMAIRKKQEIR